MNALLGKEIGRGGFGVIYTNKSNPRTCIKVSSKIPNNSTCRQWSNEYKKIISITDILETNNDYKKMSNVRIVKPIRFIEAKEKNKQYSSSRSSMKQTTSQCKSDDLSNFCYMEMPYIFYPSRDDATETIQALLGEETMQKLYPGRGLFIGLHELREILSNEELKRASFELGIMMGLIHYIAKNDAFDIEVIFGKEYNAKKCRFYIVDFDLTATITEYDDNTIERLVWSLEALPYFPRKSVDTELYELFRKGYETIVPVTIAERVFANYG